MKPLISMRDALADEDLFGRVLKGESWGAWRILLTAAMGEPLTDEERCVFEQLTGRPQEPAEPVDELWAIVGRRGGKTRAAAVLAAYLASLCDWKDFLAPGERASLPIMSASIWQAAKARNYLIGLYSEVKAFRKQLANITGTELSLANGVDIEPRAASFRTARGATAVSAICDELAFWHSDESRNPDVEILNAIRPSLATTGGMLICISSPYARRGALYDAYRRDYGANGDPKILVAKADSRTMNSSLPEAVIVRAYERDPTAASAEYGGEFRADIEAFISREVVEAAVVANRFELPPSPGVRYCAFVDPSGGSADDMTLCVAHRDEGGVIIVDAIRAVTPPFSPDAVAQEFATLIKSYGLSKVHGDRYAGEWPRERFAAHGVRYEVGAKAKSEIYKELLPLMNAGRVELVDHRKLTNQLSALERRTARGGRDSIDHAPGQHDDVANCFAGAAVMAAAAGTGPNVMSMPFSWA
ncbi:hypothetical protein [Methylocystis echinoides]|uniref:hypothetical protein n=1 Tax=Methylocystis echinoides TaxID=29468 RepID=UPI00342FB587